MKAAVLLSLSALALAAPAPAPNAGTKIAFSRKRHEGAKRADGTADVDLILSQFRDAIIKYNPNFDLPEGLKNAQPLRKRAFKEHLTDQVESGEDELYYGVGLVGAAKQSFTFDFDTGSSDVFLPGPSCTKADGCVGTTRYNQQGVNEGNTTSVTYGSGSVKGNNYFDTLTVAGAKATHQNLISLTTASGFASSDSDGLIGMGFESIAQSKSSPFPFTLFSEGVLNPTEFSFFLGRAKSGTAGASELTLGGRDPTRYVGPFHSVPVTTQGYWQVAVQGASAGSAAALPTTEGQAAIDTGTTLIIAPTVAATAIYAGIPGAVPLPGLSGSPTVTLFGYPCSESPKVSFELGGKKFLVNPIDFNFGSVTSGLSLGNAGAEKLASSGLLCVGGIAAADLDPTENLYVLGDTFIKNWYATFSYDESTKKAAVLFAKSL